MFIGSANINYDEIRNYVGKPKELVHYVDNLVPRWAQCIQPVIMNQRYYVALHIRNAVSIPYKLRKEMITSLIEGVRIVGCTNNFYEISDLLEYCDQDTLCKMLELALKGDVDD